MLQIGVQTIPYLLLVFIGGTDASDISNIIDTVNINSAGNATDYGDTSAVGERWAGAGSATRAVMGGNTGKATTIYYVTIPTAGTNATFGNLTESKEWMGALSNATRAVFGGVLSQEMFQM